MPVTLTLSHFDPEQITQSGQCFRMVGVDGSTHELIAFGRCLRVTTLGGGRYRFTCTPAEMAALWRAYFDLDTDYAALLAAAPPDDAFFNRPSGAGTGCASCGRNRGKRCAALSCPSAKTSKPSA